MKTKTIALVIVVLVAGFVISNRMSYEDGLSDQAFKCQMIAEKTWPNVDNHFEKVCKS